MPNKEPEYVPPHRIPLFGIKNTLANIAQKAADPYI